MSETNVVISFKCDVSQAHAAVGRAVGALQDLCTAMGIELTPIPDSAPDEFDLESVQPALAHLSGQQKYQGPSVLEWRYPAVGSYWRRPTIASSRYRITDVSLVSGRVIAAVLSLSGSTDPIGEWQGSVADFNNQFEEWRD